MLFNSYIFILLFLPVTLAGFWLLGSLRLFRSAKAWLVVTSLFFYGWWNPKYLLLIVLSMAGNFALGAALSRSFGRPEQALRHRLLLILGVVANLGLLGYYKYTNFLLANIDQLFGLDLQVATIILPLGISFFTFQQMAYVVDASRGLVREYNVVDYALFVVFFPQLIAGPIVHHADVLPQFARQEVYRFRGTNMAVGASIFAMGLFKKVVLADGVARFATPVFAASAAGTDLTLLEAWAGALAYTAQLYFDFSGYSDMAIGLGRMFAIRLPQNFNSPYQAVSIIDFWQRWHITLSQFLRDYLYIPLGGNRRGPARRYVNLLLTMLLGGLWHGAGWTFVVWGGLHGLYLTVNHAWRAWWSSRPHARPDAFHAPARLLTFLCVVVGWVFFRSADVDTALRMLRGMAGLNGVSVPAELSAWLGGWPLAFQGAFPAAAFALQGLPWVVVLLAVAWWAPNVVQVHARYRPIVARRRPAGALRTRLAWRPSVVWALVTAGLLLGSFLRMSQISEFLYFQF
jgi:alginate O-acetyltransferase complex protein AlgI